MNAQEFDTKTGFVFEASFPGGSEYWRPSMTYLAEFLRVAYGMRLITSRTNRELIIADGTNPNGGRWWTLTDNGGEINLHLINSDDLPRSVPYAQHTNTAPIGRVAFFCRCVMHDQPIEDYSTSPMEDVTLRMLLGHG